MNTVYNEMFIINLRKIQYVTGRGDYLELYDVREEIEQEKLDS